MKHYKANHSNDAVATELQNKSDQPITKELNRLSQQLDTDVRENLPPQMLAVVVGVLKLIEDIEES